MNIRLIFTSLLFVLILQNFLLAKLIEPSGNIDYGLRPFYGITIGDFSEKYSNPMGFYLFSRGLIQLNLFGGNLFYPEVRAGWFNIPHKTEPDRKLDIFAIYADLIWDLKMLHYNNFLGEFIILPYFGIGANYIRYASSQTSQWGVSPGYNVGVNFQYRLKKIKKIFVEFGTEYYFVTEIDPSLTGFDPSLTGFAFSLGAGYSFDTDMSEYNKKQNLKKKYLEYLKSDNEERIIEASDWLGKERVKEAVPNLIDLLLKHKNPKVRKNAGIALGFIRDKSALNHLADSYLKDNDPDVKYTSLLSISRIGPDKKIMGLLKKSKKDNKDPYIIDYINKMEELFD